MSDQTTNIPAVYTGIAAVLSALSVEKNGTLPSNMGGRGYITASDLNSEIKRQFVTNNLILLPSEREISHEVIQFKERLNVAVSIEGTYTIVSTVDGSQAVVQGVGDGLASGTAVASNIGSTNALKNALLRTFLVTEQSVEDQAKNGEGDTAGPDRAAQRIATAAQGGPAPATGTTGTPANAEVLKLQGEVKDAANARRKVEPDFPTHVQFAAKYLGNDAMGWSKDVAKLAKVRDAIKAGEAY